MRKADRRNFIKATATIGASAMLPKVLGKEDVSFSTVDSFDRADSLFHGAGWETQNPGYWQIKNKALRRRLKNVGERARRTGFPFHSSKGSNPKGDGKMKTDYDPSLPAGILWRRDWKMNGSFSIQASGIYRGGRPTDVPENDDPTWKMFGPGYGMFGLAFGGKALFEGFTKNNHPLTVGWHDDHSFRIGAGKSVGLKPAKVEGPDLKEGDAFTIEVQVACTENQALVRGVMNANGQSYTLPEVTIKRWSSQGYVGVVGRGLIDFEFSEFGVSAVESNQQDVGHCECLSCWSIGDSLEEVDGKWQVKFMSLFASDGEKAEIRVANKENPEGGWDAVPVAGSALIVNHEWRRNTSVITATLPMNPAEADLFYTIWKDGVNVTSDPRIGTSACGPGSGFVGDVPAQGGYVGRLPQLVAPYKMAGLSCHAITGGLQQK
ncbi:MAG: hypothetical protein AAF226_12910, partial [Verrucomicrobiota bacterium]